MNRAASRIVILGFSLGCGAAAGEVVAVVSARSPVTVLTRNEVTDLFLGRSSRFPGGTFAVPIDQRDGTAARDEFYLAFAGKSAAQLNAHWSKIIFTGRGQPPVEAANGEAVKRILLANPAAIGYMERGLVDAGLRVVLSQ